LHEKARLPPIDAIDHFDWEGGVITSVVSNAVIRQGSVVSDAVILQGSAVSDAVIWQGIFSWLMLWL
jgi:hypothetical protein